jgi:hypothetical protein
VNLDVGGGGGIPEIPGEPDGLRAGAAGLSAAGAQLSALAGEVVGSTANVPWTGIAALAARGATVAASVPLRDADGHLSEAAGALRRYASELEEAQKEAERARTRLADALVAASSAATSLGLLMVEEDADPAAVARMGDRLDAANADAAAARTAGAQAFERAEQAASTAAATFSAVAAAAPDPPPPPPPPPPPKEEDDGGFLSGALGVGKDVLGGIGDGASWAAGGVADGATWTAGKVADGWEWAGDQGDPWNPHSPAFAVDVIEGAAGAVWGVGELGWQGIKASTVYERFDPEGSAEARQGFADGAEYAWQHPWETAKAVLGINHFENGEPGKFAGEAGITALATLASGGAAAGLKGASGASKVRKLDDLVDAGNAARAADDVSDLQKLGKLDYSDRMAREVPNFAEPRPVPHTGTKPHDELLVNVGDSSRAVGTERSMGWWVPLDEARTRVSVEEFRNAYALPEHWKEGGTFQAKDDVVIARIPAGTETTRLEGIAAPQRDVPDPRPGGGRQIFFQEFDTRWIESRISMDEFLGAGGRRP